MKSKIAFISTMEGYPWGGSEELWSQSALELLQAGFRVAARVKRWKVEPVMVGRLRASGCKLSFKESPTFLGKMVQKATSRGDPVTRWLNEESPDLVVISQGAFSDGVNVAVECRRLNLNYCLISQCVSENDWPSDGRRELIVSAHRGAKRSYFLSQRNLEVVSRVCTTVLPNAEIVFNPFKVSFCAKRTYPPCATNLRLACVARLEPFAKGQEVLLMALAERNLRSYEIQIDFYGAGPAEVGLKALAGHLSLKNVHFRGFATDIEKLWDEYHALVMPSRFEGLPLALIEAMLCHRAAVVTDVGGNCEYVEDGITGFVVEAPVPSALNRGLIRCWQSREKLKEMGELAGSRVRQLVPAEPARVFANRLMCLL